jgi:hypothetical protein
MQLSLASKLAIFQGLLVQLQHLPLLVVQQHYPAWLRVLVLLKLLLRPPKPLQAVNLMQVKSVLLPF